MDQRVRGVVGDAQNLGGIFATFEGVELVARVLSGFVKIVGHRIQPR
jgi:hypothetical protein